MSNYQMANKYLVFRYGTHHMEDINMKKFENAELVELNIAATEQEPTDTDAVDLWQDGWFKQGIKSGSTKPGTIDDYR